MSRIDRRTFVENLALLPVGATIAARPMHEQFGRLFVGQRDRALLMALAEAVLPAELGPDGWGRAAERFERWVSDFTPGAELNHGYGTDQLRRAGRDPWPVWQQQLRALDAESERRAGQPFARATGEQRRAMVESEIEALGVTRLPQPLEAEHVALGLLAWFYASSEATDLCYGARIGRENCRLLDDVENEPRPL